MNITDQKSIGFIFVLIMKLNLPIMEKKASPNSESKKHSKVE